MIWSQLGALLTQVFDANTTWKTPGKSPIAGLRKGRDNVFAHFGGTYGAGTDGIFKAELQYVTADANGVAERMFAQRS